MTFVLLHTVPVTMVFIIAGRELLVGTTDHHLIGTLLVIIGCLVSVTVTIMVVAARRSPDPRSTVVQPRARPVDVNDAIRGDLYGRLHELRSARFSRNIAAPVRSAQDTRERR